MPQPQVSEYKSDIVLGKKYRDEQTGIEGVATAIYFYQHSCCRVEIETVSKKDGEIKAYVFDSPRLICLETFRPITAEKTGGPKDNSGARGNSGRR